MREAHSREWWRATVANWTASGQTAAAFAAPLGVDPKSLSWWRGLLRREATSLHKPAARFVEVHVPHPSPLPALAPPPEPALPAAAPAQPQSLVARVGAVRFDVSVGTDPGYLAALFAAVGKAGIPC